MRNAPVPKSAVHDMPISTLILSHAISLWLGLAVALHMLPQPLTANDACKRGVHCELPHPADAKDLHPTRPAHVPAEPDSRPSRFTPPFLPTRALLRIKALCAAISLPCGYATTARDAVHPAG